MKQYISFDSMKAIHAIMDKLDSVANSHEFLSGELAYDNHSHKICLWNYKMDSVSFNDSLVKDRYAFDEILSDDFEEKFYSALNEKLDSLGDYIDFFKQLEGDYFFQLGGLNMNKQGSGTIGYIYTNNTVLNNISKQFHEKYRFDFELSNPFGYIQINADIPLNQPSLNPSAVNEFYKDLQAQEYKLRPEHILPRD